MSTTNNQNDLGKTLWAIADQLRGIMNADDFRDYMLSFLFLRSISDIYTEAVKKELGKDYPDDTPQDVMKKLGATSYLQIWYEENVNDIEEFERVMRRRIHFVIKPRYLWQNIYEMSRTQDEDLLKTLEDGFNYIENESFESTFHGLFSEINLNSDKLGKTPRERNDLLCKIIVRIAEGITQFPKDADNLGNAYEYLIGQFAAGSGKKAGEFYTPQKVSTILSRIVTLDCQSPENGSRKRINRVLDMTCGSGSLLLNVHHECEKQKIELGKIYGQEKNITTYNLARMNMILHKVKDTEFIIHHGDTLTNDWDLFNEPNPAKKLKFDAVVANPPFSLRWEPSEDMIYDFRFQRYGVAPKIAADFAFLLHGFHYLSEEGTMAIILPHGVLFRSGKEEAIRKKLLMDDNIDAVIGLPQGLFYSTGIPVCIIVLKKCRKNDDILIINASGKEHFARGRKQNELREDDVNDIVNTYKFRKEEPRYSRRVSLKEIKENDYNLNITRYVDLTTEEEPIDLNQVHIRLVDIEKEIASAKAEHNKYLRELGLPELP